MEYFAGTDKDTARSFPTLEEARAFAAVNAIYGFRAFDAEGQTYFAPYDPLVCDLLAAAKRITDFVRHQEFTYGDAPIHPAMDHQAKKISCDRLIDWALYDCGFTDQPRVQGMCVSGPGLTNWCIAHGFIKIETTDLLLPGDIIFTRPNAKGHPGHTFLHAGRFADACFRYDCGSDKRIRSVQPFWEPIEDFMYAYRPVKGNGK